MELKFSVAIDAGAVVLVRVLSEAVIVLDKVLFEYELSWQDGD
jgi:hypothetical protein